MHSSLWYMESDELLGSAVCGSGSSEGVTDEDERRLRVYEQLFGILYTQRLWKLKPQTGRGERNQRDGSGDGRTDGRAGVDVTETHTRT